MAKDIYIGEVAANEEIQINYFLMKVMLPSSFTEPLPGQFVMIRIAGLHDPFLSRPISIYSYTRGKSHCAIELLYRVAGKGTQILAGLIKGSQVEISGPLGGSYTIDPLKKNIVFIAGGIGIAPLSWLAKCFCQKDGLTGDAMTFYLGAQTAEAVVGLDRIQKLCYNIIVCTDDGSLGAKALVTRMFQKDIKTYSPSNTIIYACGPKVMLQSLSTILSGKYVCQVSLEERMACGVGACVGCVVAVKDGQGKPAFKRVCADGPVFDLEKVIWE
ncbi:MAG: Dihydroorotate dehydrogenase B (NAD(+)) electron transfer subunit [Syntrophaceae bacterium]|nr:MAG: Dihydroorotate dehydrogenase B (NAD(+)) electron transfer subunit [Syntrophaceae bacterium]